MVKVSNTPRIYDGGTVNFFGVILILVGIGAIVFSVVDQPTFRNRDFDEVYNIGLVYNHLLIAMGGSLLFLVGCIIVATVRIKGAVLNRDA